METDELPPGRGLLPLRGRWDAVTLEDVAHGLIAHRVSKIVQCPHNPIIASGTILSGHTHHQGLRSWSTRGRPRAFSGFEPSPCRVTNLRYQARMVAGWAIVAISPR